VARIARVMIDVDPNLGRANGGQAVAEPILNCSIERDRNIDIFRFNRWFGEKVRIREKAVLLEHAFFVPDAHVFAELFQGNTERELTPERIAIRTNVTKNRTQHTFTQPLPDLL